MIILYITNYDSVKNLKIEFKDNRFFLNCKTLRDLIGLIYKHNPNYNVNDYYKLIKDIRHHLIAFKEYEQTDKIRAEFCLSKLVTEEGFLVPRQHFSYETKTNAIRDNTILFHATSNTKTTLVRSQTSAVALPELIKSGSKNPGTIITEGNYRLIKYSTIRHVS